MTKTVDPFDAPRRDIRILTLTGPSAAGKTTLIREIVRRHPDRFKLVVSLTSRPPRETDLPGEYRCGMTDAEFRELQRENALLWITPPIQGGHRYGTLKRSVNQAVAGPEIGIMVLVPDMVKLLRAHVGDERVLSLFVQAKDPDVLRERLMRRARLDFPMGPLPDNVRREIETRIVECADWEQKARISPVPFVFFDNSMPLARSVAALEQTLRRHDVPV